jgi:periplasmic protein TonB
MLIRLFTSLVVMTGIVSAQSSGTAGSNQQQGVSVPAIAHTNGPSAVDGVVTDASTAPTVKGTVNGITAPVPIKTPQAKYSREARKKKIEAQCLVSIIVDTNGLPQNAKIIRSVGYGLDESALAAIKKYRFKPAMKDGHPVAVEMKIEVNFRLR